MFTDEELLPISTLQHYTFCPRRAALVYLERQWADNRFTAEGGRLHQRAHDPGRGESRPGRQITRGLEVRSLRLGLAGKCDVVEFHTGEDGCLTDVVLVEYKRGRPKPHREMPFRVQLCAQALCLEEMMDLEIPQGYIFFGKTRRREEIVFDANLRQRTTETAAAIHRMIAAGKTPPAKYQAKCKHCSMIELCLPRAMRPRATASRYLVRLAQDNAEP